MTEVPIIKTYSKKQPFALHKTSATLVPVYSNPANNLMIRESRLNDKTLEVETFDDTFDRLASDIVIPSLKNSQNHSNIDTSDNVFKVPSINPVKTRKKARKKDEEEFPFSKPKERQKKAKAGTNKSSGVKRKRVNDGSSEEDLDKDSQETEQENIKENVQARKEKQKIRKENKKKKTERKDEANTQIKECTVPLERYSVTAILNESDIISSQNNQDRRSLLSVIEYQEGKEIPNISLLRVRENWLTSTPRGCKMRISVNISPIKLHKENSINDEQKLSFLETEDLEQLKKKNILKESNMNSRMHLSPKELDFGKRTSRAVKSSDHVLHENAYNEVENEIPVAQENIEKADESISITPKIVIVNTTNNSINNENFQEDNNTINRRSALQTNANEQSLNTSPIIIKQGKKPNVSWSESPLLFEDTQYNHTQNYKNCSVVLSRENLSKYFTLDSPKDVAVGNKSENKHFGASTNESSYYPDEWTNDYDSSYGEFAVRKNTRQEALNSTDNKVLEKNLNDVSTKSKGLGLENNLSIQLEEVSVLQASEIQEVEDFVISEVHDSEKSNNTIVKNSVIDVTFDRSSIPNPENESQRNADKRKTQSSRITSSNEQIKRVLDDSHEISTHDENNVDGENYENNIDDANKDQRKEVDKRLNGQEVLVHISKLDDQNVENVSPIVMNKASKRKRSFKSPNKKLKKDKKDIVSNVEYIYATSVEKDSDNIEEIDEIAIQNTLEESTEERYDELLDKQNTFDKSDKMDNIEETNSRQNISNKSQIESIQSEEKRESLNDQELHVIITKLDDKYTKHVSPILSKKKSRKKNKKTTNKKPKTNKNSINEADKKNKVEMDAIGFRIPKSKSKLTEFDEADKVRSTETESDNSKINSYTNEKNDEVLRNTELRILVSKLDSKKIVKKTALRKSKSNKNSIIETVNKNAIVDANVAESAVLEIVNKPTDFNQADNVESTDTELDKSNSNLNEEDDEIIKNKELRISVSKLDNQNIENKPPILSKRHTKQGTEKTALRKSKSHINIIVSIDENKKLQEVVEPRVSKTKNKTTDFNEVQSTDSELGKSNLENNTNQNEKNDEKMKNKELRIFLPKLDSQNVENESTTSRRHTKQRTKKTALKKSKSISITNDKENNIENNPSNVDNVESTENNLNNDENVIPKNITENEKCEEINKSYNGQELSVLLSKLNDPVKITVRRNAYKKWDRPLAAITEDQVEQSSNVIAEEDEEVENTEKFVTFRKSQNVNDEAKRNSSLEEHEIDKSTDDDGPTQHVILKPGKSWARSLSIINHFYSGQNLDELAAGRGKNWRYSVQSILNMQPEGFIKSSNRKTDEVRESNAHNTRNSLQLPRESNKISSIVTSPSRYSRFSIRIIPSDKRSTLTDDFIGSLRSSSIADRTRKTSVARKTSLKIRRDTLIETEEDLIRSAKDIILKRCKQTSYLPFSDCFPDSYIDHCRKIGEGVYGEVFLYASETEKSVIKIIPIEGGELVNCEPQKKFHEILSEIIISEELHKLRFGNEYNTHGFVGVNRIMCVIGKYPDKLIYLWNAYDEEKKSENDCPSMFDDQQLYIILELAHGGQDLEAYVFQNASESFSIFLQTAFSLAVAEKSLEFEHRDLHWGNVLISKTDDTRATFKLGSDEISLPLKGVEVSVIDFTLSRMSYQGCKIFNDLAADPTLFTAQGEYQFDIYRLMRDSVNNDWQQFNPYTNVLWLDYTLDKMITAVRYKKKTTKVHKTAIDQMKELRKEILNYKSAFDFVNNCETITIITNSGDNCA